MVHGSIGSTGVWLDFGALPPEINSGRMYLGPGSGPLTTAASAWDALATELTAAANGYASVISELTGNAWRGPTSVVMAAAVTPFVAWFNESAGNAAMIAGQAQAAAAAYELAFSMTVPPPVIAANRSLLLALVATNFFGQNAPAIAAAEAHYAQMWLQDATAMNLYAESSALATVLPSFAPPPRTTNPVGSAAQSSRAAATAAPQLGTALSSPLVQVLERVPNVTNSVLSSANAVTAGRGIHVVNMRLAAQDAAQSASPFPLGVLTDTAGPGGPGASAVPRVTAGWGRGGLVGKLSAPPSWFATAPEVLPTGSTLPNSIVTAAPAASAEPAGCGSVFSQSVLGTLSRDGPQPARAKSKPIIVRSPAAG